MKVSFRPFFWVVSLFCLPCILLATEPVPTSDTLAPERVDLFEAMDQGLIDVSLTHRSSLEGRVTVKNKSGKPLEIILPSAFSGVPLAQGFDEFGGGGGGGGGGGARRGGGGGGGQSTGGGGMGGRGGGGGGWNLGPDKVFYEKVSTVCLEYGKKEPRPHMRYTLRPIEETTSNKAVQAACSMLGSEGVNQQAVQACVWHLNNNLSWEELSNKTYKPRIDSSRVVPYFTARELDLAQKITVRAKEIARKMESESMKHPQKDIPKSPDSTERPKQESSAD